MVVPEGRPNVSKAVLVQTAENGSVKPKGIKTSTRYYMTSSA